MKEICLVHLVRACNGTEPFVRFLESYRENPGGVEHDLLIIFKGFDQTHDIELYKSLLAHLQPSILEVSDGGFDFTAYFTAAKHYSEQYKYFCFLNSHSVIKDYAWLEKLYRHITKPDVGLVSATGSWLSQRENVPVPSWKLPFCLPVHRYKHHINTFPLKRFVAAFYRGWQQIPFYLSFDLFPNYHARTNAFMISSKLMETIKCPRMRTKEDAYKMESGKKGLTRQVLTSGKQVLVVGKDGIGYSKECWNKSKTFWQSSQENLLVADNQTRDYIEGDDKRRHTLRSLAWGGGEKDTRCLDSTKQI